jgi:hypothetical protein
MLGRCGLLFYRAPLKSEARNKRQPELRDYSFENNLFSKSAHGLRRHRRNELDQQLPYIRSRMEDCYFSQRHLV